MKHIRGPFCAGLAIVALVTSTAAPTSAFEVQCGQEGGDAFGWAVASGSDFDGDGKPDLAIGAPCSWVGSSIRAGRVTVYSGASGSVLLSMAGSDPEEKLGSALDWVGDVDGDGRAELAIGSATFAAPKPGGGTLLAAGRVQLLSSKGGFVWTAFGSKPNEFFGETVSVVPDVNGDGKPEVAIGASGGQTEGGVRGSAFLLSGANGSQIARTDGEEEEEQWGSLVGHAGDIDGDGTADWFASTRVGTTAETSVALGAGSTTTTTTSTTTTTLNPRAGRLTVMSGEPPYEELQTYRGATHVDRLGRAAVPTGDMDGDDLGEFWIGSPGAEPTMLDDAGSITLFSAAGDAIREIFEPLPQQSAAFGTSIVAPGSLDGGSTDDVVAGAPLGRVGGKSQAGRLHAFDGNDGSLIWTVSGELLLERFGQSLDAGFDLDTDGKQDLLVGAPGDSPGGKRGAGSAFILSGADGSRLMHFKGRRGRETRLFLAGPELSREPLVRAFDPRGRRREMALRPFRGQTSTELSLAVLNGGRREETLNGLKTLLAVGTGRGGSRPEVAVYRTSRRRQEVSSFTAGPPSYTGGLNVGAGEFYVEEGDELAVVPADSTNNEVLLQVYWAAFPDPLTGRIAWAFVREFKVFEATDKVNNQFISASGAILASGEFTGDSFDEIVAAPAAGLPVVRVLSRTGTLIREWQAFPAPGEGPQPNSGVALAVGNLDGDGAPEIVTAPAAGQPLVRAWNADGSVFNHAPGQPVNFGVTAFGLQSGGGLVVAVADVDLDGQAEIVVAPRRGITGQVLAFEPNGSLVAGWQVYEPFGSMPNGGLGLVGLDQFWRR